MKSKHAAERHRRQNGAFRAGIEEGRRREREAQSIPLGSLANTPDFMLGDRVQKVGGRYGGPGRVVGISEDLDGDGYRLYQVAMRVEGGFGEFVHVFPAACLRLDVSGSTTGTSGGRDDG
jgi:hypothetical protein